MLLVQDREWLPRSFDPTLSQWKEEKSISTMRTMETGVGDGGRVFWKEKQSAFSMWVVARKCGDHGCGRRKASWCIK
jgi:hypothetical protein